MTTDTKKFAVGEKVTWLSQSRGYWRTKTGTVVRVIPANTLDYQAGRINHGSGKRNHDSYIVEVPQGTTGKAKPKLYWPNVVLLKKAD